MHQSSAALLGAFPVILRGDASLALSVFPENPRPVRTFPVRVANEVVALPSRLYHNPALIDMASLTSLQSELVACLLTRHHDGFVREENLKRIICSDHFWIPAFVLPLLGEYVIEILQIIQQNLTSLDQPIYREFLQENPEFFAMTKQRLISYWNCYYRNIAKSEYVGFRLLKFFESLVPDD
jgi:hypothetical protein